jgi:hypothetical protein
MVDKRFLSVSLVFTFALASTSTHQQAAPESRQVIPSAAHCRHEGPAQPSDSARRQAALVLARAINTAEGAQAQQTRRYQPLSELRNLPGVPAGFELRFYSDSAGYMFALKDTMDSCRYAIFSDQSGLLYEKSARTAPQLAH